MICIDEGEGKGDGEGRKRGREIAYGKRGNYVGEETNNRQ